MKLFAFRSTPWMGKWMLAVVVLASLAGTAHAADNAQAQAALTTVASLNPNLRPQNVPLNYVVTPNGYFAASCVQAVQQGEKIHRDGSIESANGSVRKPVICTQPHYTQNGARIEANGGVTSLATKKPASGYSGWFLTAYYTTSSGVGSIAADWVVPSSPSQTTDQVDYFFPGLEQSESDGESILQPVLGYNAFSGSGVSLWTLSSWNCCVSGTTYYSGPVNTAAGDQIYGIVTATCNGGSDCATITSTDETNGHTTTLQTDPYAALTWVFGGTLEAYNISNCNLLPASKSVVYTGIKVKDQSGNVISQSWTPWNVIGSSSPQCNYGISTTTSSVTLDY
jgi:hypothetical protein